MLIDDVVVRSCVDATSRAALRCRPYAPPSSRRTPGPITPGSRLGQAGRLPPFASCPPRRMGRGSAPRRAGARRGLSGTTAEIAARAEQLEHKRSRSRGTSRPSSAISSPSHKMRGRRECRVKASPMARLRKKMQAAGTTGSAEHPAFPARCLHAYTQSPWCAGLVGHHDPRDASASLRT